jgi:hypothetical protein
VSVEGARRIARSPHTPLLLVQAAVVGAVLWPAIRHFATQPMIGTGDSSVFYWAWWHLPEATLDGRNPFDTTAIMHPVGVDLSLTTTVPSVAYATWPVRLLLGPAAQINAVQLASTYVAAVATYFVAFRVTGRRAAALVAAVVFAFTPFRFVHLSDHLNLIHTGFLPLVALLVLRLRERPTGRRAAVLGAGLGLAFLTDPQIAVYSAVVAAVVLLVRRRDAPVGPGTLAWTALVAAAVSLPLLVPMGMAVATGEAEVDSTSEHITAWSSSPFSWVLPAPDHWLLGELSDRAGATVSGEALVYPGMAALAIALFGWLRARPRERRVWAVVGVVGFVLSLGPYLSHGGERSPVPLPFLALQAIPGLDVIRVPGRFGIVGVLGISILAALGARALLERVPPGRVLVVTGLVVAVVLVDLVPPALPQRDDVVPEPYHAIAAHDGGGAVLELPLQWATGVRLVGGGGHGYQGKQMVYATVHGRPLASGSVSRLSTTRLERLLAVPLYAAVLQLQSPGGPDPDVAPTIDRAMLRAAGIGYVVHHRDVAVPRVRRAIQALELPVLASDGDVTVWLVPEGDRSIRLPPR